MKNNRTKSIIALLCVLNLFNIEAKSAVTVEWKYYARYAVGYGDAHDLPARFCYQSEATHGRMLEKKNNAWVEREYYYCNQEREIPIGQSQTFTEPVVVMRQVMDMLYWGIPLQPKPTFKISFRKLIATKPEPMLGMVFLAQRKRVMLNYPPAGTVWHVPGGLSQLTAVLRSRGHEVTQRYGHIIGLEHLLLSRSEPDIIRSLTTVRAPDPTIQEMYAARQTFERVSTSIPTKDRFRFERNNVVYLSQYQDGSINGALEAIKNRENNLWYDYFSKVEVPLARDYKPHVYGISVGDERQLFPGLILASMIKDALPDCLVVMGGNFWCRIMVAYQQPEFAQMFNHFDAIVYREGYQPLQSLIETLDPAQASGTVWRKNGEVVVNPQTVNPTDFESIPTPQFDGGARQWSPDFTATLYTSSGCVKRCGFCAIPALDDGRYLKMKPRYMSAAKTARDMAALGTTKFDLVNELLSIDFQLELGAELKRIGHSATWQCYLTIAKELANPQVCEQLYQAGCRAVQLGLETLDKATLLREFKAWNNPANYCRILANLRNAGIQTHVFLMLGLPGEQIHQGIRWTGFLEECGRNILTIKSGRYRLSRMSPEEMLGLHSQYIEVAPPEKNPMHLNRDFRYKKIFETMTNTKVDAVRDVVEQACRKHWAYGVTSTIPWWINRSRYTWEQMEQMAKALPPEPDIPHLKDRIAQMRYVVRSELKRDANFQTFDEMTSFARTLL